MPITCLDADTLDAYLQGQLEDPSLDAHLEECPACQSALDQRDAAVNGAFERLREPASATEIWEQPTFLQLVAHAKEINPAARSSGE